MKTRFRFFILLLCGLCARGVSAGDYPPVDVDMQLRQLTEHVYFAQGESGMATENKGFISNAGVIVTDEGVVVFDALASPSLAQLLYEKIRAITDKPVVRVIVSHYHADHIYGLQFFKELGAEIWAPAGADEYLDSEAAQERLEERRFSLEPWVNDDTRLVRPDRYVREGDSFELGGVRFTVSVVGAAHSDGDMTLYVEPDRVLFSGDILFEGRIPFVGDGDTGHWLDVINRMQEQRLVALVPGHGSVADDPNQTIATTQRYLAHLREHMGEAAANFVPFDQAYRETDWSGFEDLPAFEDANRRNAYQVFLSMEAELLGQ